MDNAIYADLKTLQKIFEDAKSKRLSSFLIFLHALSFIVLLISLLISAIVVLPFNILISEKIALPFAFSSPAQIILFAVFVFVLSVASCMISSLSAVVRISKFEPYGDVK